MRYNFLPRLMMVDNTQLNLGSGGDLIASDDIGGVKHQKVKMEFGADGTATEVSSANPLPTTLITGRTTVGRYAYGSFRMLGTAATPQNLFTVENPVGSGKNVMITRLTCQNDSTAVLVSVSPSMKTSRISIPSGGTTGTATKFVSTDASPVAIVRNGTASDGGAATAITATAGNTISHQLVDRLHTAVGQVLHDTSNMLPQLVEDTPFVLVPGEALLVQAVLANAATRHFVINIVWEEYT